LDFGFFLAFLNSLRFLREVHHSLALLGLRWFSLLRQGLRWLVIFALLRQGLRYRF
jgi:hypothetical protein